MTVTEILHDAAEVAARVETLAGEIDRAIAGDFTLLGILKGSFVFVADLARALDARGRRFRIDFIRLSSYGAAKHSAGEVRLVGDPPGGISGRKILLIDDIADSGRTLAYARDLMFAHGAAGVWTCVLADKPSRREIAFEADFVGFQVPDVFIVGYGIDYAEDHRHLPYIAKVD